MDLSECKQRSPKINTKHQKVPKILKTTLLLKLVKFESLFFFLEEKIYFDFCSNYFSKIYIQILYIYYIFTCIWWFFFVLSFVYILVAYSLSGPLVQYFSLIHFHVKKTVSDMHTHTPRKPKLKETRAPQCSSQHCL